MKTTATTFVILAFLLTGFALAQEPTPAPAPPPEEQPAAEPQEEPAAAEPQEEPAAAEPQEEPVAAAPAAAPAEPAAAAAPAAPAVPTIYRDKTKIEVRGKAENNGQLKLVFQPNGEDGIVVTINVIERTNAKKITDEIQNQLKFAVEPRYVVKRKNDRQILIKGKKGTPAAAVKIESQALSGVSVMISRG